MLRLCLVHRCIPIGVACRTLGYRVPPTNKRDLKKRFVQLTKETHPDLHAGDEKAATARMVQLTEAYTCLKKLLEHRVQHAQRTDFGERPFGAGASTKPGTAAQSHANEWAEVAASFRAPGSSISLRGFALPWQRTTTTSNSSSSTTIASMEAKMSEANLSFSDFVRYARRHEQQHRQREEAIRNDAAMADGTHGFTAEYFEKTQANRAAMRGTEKHGMVSTRLMALGALYYGRRLRRALTEAPRTAWHTLRYIISGH
ncbi:hypothetical protein JKF63_07663 [Porcisia hertigi]|uniref:J domain-containing protein n=1 Tax=Porcisia hertigi TaxID=2761500 RepID=A0A836LFQ0_9TRYP|nr:hypothetical protein JKF63_07663 [Porcisia hertigi]